MSAINALSSVIGLNYVTGSPWPKEKSLSRELFWLSSAGSSLVIPRLQVKSASLRHGGGAWQIGTPEEKPGVAIEEGFACEWPHNAHLGPNGLVRTSNVSVMHGTRDRCPPVIVVCGG